MKVSFDVIGLLCAIVGAIFIGESNLPNDIALPMVILWSMFCGLMSTEVSQPDDDPKKKD